MSYVCIFLKEISFYAYLRSRSGAARRSSISGQEVLLTRQPEKQAAAPVMFGPCTEMEMRAAQTSLRAGGSGEECCAPKRPDCALGCLEETLPRGF